MPRMTAPVFCSLLYASRNPHASMVQPGVSALGKKKRTTVLPRRDLRDTTLPFWSGKLKSGAFSPFSMPLSPMRHLYSRAAGAVICAALTMLLCASAARAQYGRRAPVSNGPRATAILQLQGKRARIVPIVIMVNGQFYDASIYRADPVPMALDSGVVYEAERGGSPEGLFTVANALQVGQHWYGMGHWETNQQIEEAKKAQAQQEAETKTASQHTLSAEDDSGPPVLRRPDDEKAPGGKPTASQPTAPKPPANAPQQTAKTSPPPPAPSGSPDEYDPNRPVLRRGAPQAASKEESSWPAEETPGSPAAAKPGAATSQLKEPKIEQMAAVSDAAGPEARSYTFSMKGEERDNAYKKMLGFAQDAVNKYERARHTNFASAQLGEADFHVYDVDLSNEPIFVLSAPATVNFGSPAAGRRSRRHTAHISEPVPGKQEQAYVTVVGHVDLYGEIKVIFSSVTDSLHLDEIPKLKLIDAVDVDGDTRGELLFEETTDSGTGYIIYRVTPDQLRTLYDSRGE